MSTETNATEKQSQTVQAMNAERFTLPTRQAWNADEVAARLGCSVRHVFRMADAGLMPWGFKLGTLRRWNSDEIESWVSGGAKPVRKGGR